jgi:Leucine-rich repeat (LRR) protein
VQVGKLGRLEQLLLRRNTIVSIPEELCECQELRTLDLSENQLQALPRSIGRLAQLTSLSLQHNKIAELPAEIGALRGMKVLKLHDNMLAALPHSIGQLSNLMELCLQENELTELPLELGQCTSLRKLYAEYNKLSTLPAEMRNLNKLVVLILHHNQLSEVPEVLLGMKQLLRLSLDNNPLKEEEAQEVIRTKGALALLQGRGEGSGSTIRATIRGNSPAGTPRPLSPLLPPGLSRTSSQQWRKSLSVTSAFGPEGDLTASNPTPTAAGLKDAKSLARVSSYTSDRLRSMAGMHACARQAFALICAPFIGPAQVTSPEDEMKVCNRFKWERYLIAL